MKQKTVFRCSIKRAKQIVSSPDYDTFESMMAAITPWLKEHCNYTTLSFWIEQRWIQEDKA